MSQLDEKQLGHRLQAARQAAGLTQQALCQRAGLSYSTLAKIERGAIKTPSIFTIQSIAAALGTTLDDLVGSPAPARAQSRHGIKFVYFDVNNTLIHFFDRAFGKLGADCGLPREVVETFFWRYNDEICRGEITIEQFNELIGKQLRLPSFDWREYYLSTTEPVPHMAELVTWVREHYRVGLLTNSMPDFLPVLREKGLLPNVNYDVIIDSSVVHLLKPEQAIYELAQAKTGCSPEEILFVDDTPANVLAARAFGWQARHFDATRPQESVDRLRSALELA